ncbi:hypothetical protein NEF87_001469 [Candidatus Lokiarchaeum ossiferum]|uniref:Uncharacterized protein n=1 Tax=Candidatus Lokiarchaeum ossiferum TaxID=2951803 RepID=A0ABY6HRI0_9ARCH|nr:hypothetical protein NEF87_001469 [Candidatus Lokiarchaeum sp. B-35]
METVFKQSSLDHSILIKRRNQIQTVMKQVDGHYIYKDGLNFNFLYSLYSQKLEYLLNGIDKIADNEFQEKVSMLNRSVKEIHKYVIK